LLRVSDGEQALSLLHKVHGYELAPRPDIILLNLNLPKRGSFEVVSEIQASELLRSIPVIMFTSSSLATEKRKALALGSRDYMSKPATLNGLIEALRSLCSQYLAEA
jgi:two-component system, chemotaxis family, response regulator Rcp1